MNRRNFLALILGGGIITQTPTPTPPGDDDCSITFRPYFIRVSARAFGDPDETRYNHDMCFPVADILTFDGTDGGLVLRGGHEYIVEYECRNAVAAALGLGLICQ